MQTRIDRLRSSAAAANSPPTPVAVPLRDLQAALKELGFYGGAVDGLDGPKTRQAVAAFVEARTDFPSDASLQAVLDATQRGAARVVGVQEDASPPPPPVETPAQRGGWVYYSPDYVTIDSLEDAPGRKLCVNELWLSDNSGFSPASEDWYVEVVPANTGKVHTRDVLATIHLTASGTCDWVAIPIGPEWPQERFTEELDRFGLIELKALMQAYRPPSIAPAHRQASPSDPDVIAKADEVGKELLRTCSSHYITRVWADCGCMSNYACDAVLSGNVSRIPSSYGIAVQFVQNPIPSACIGRKAISAQSFQRCTEFNEIYRETRDCECVRDETVKVFEADPRINGSSGYDEAQLIAYERCK